MTNERGRNELPDERAARIQAAKDRAAAAKAARESGSLPSSPVSPVEPAPAAAVAPVAAAPVVDDRPRTASGTLKRDPNEPKQEAPATPEERAARLAAAKAAAAAAKAAREAGGVAPVAVSAAVASVDEVAPAAAAGPVDDRPRTAYGTLKRDPNEVKKEPPATPEERAARLVAAKAAAAAAKAAREAGGGAPAVAGRVAAAATATTAAEAAVTAPAANDGIARTAKGTIKRDPNAPKKEAPATPEERAARLAAAKAAAVAARERAKTVPEGTATPLGKGPVVAAAGPASAANPAADVAAFKRAYEAITAPVARAEPVLRPVATLRAERALPPSEFPATEAAQSALSAFREAMDSIPFEARFNPLDVTIVVDRADLYRVLERAKLDQRLEMNLLRSISGVDQLDQGIEIVYHVKSMTTKHALAVSTTVPLSDPVVDSVTPLWRGANWHERELMEMFGVRCANHPDPRNLLLDEDMTIHPLLKAHPLADVELKQGVNVF